MEPRDPHCDWGDGILSSPLPAEPKRTWHVDALGRGEIHLGGGDPEKAISPREHACLSVSDLASCDAEPLEDAISEDAILEGSGRF